jgi:hypothetical protein
MTRENFMNRSISIRAGMGILKSAAVLAFVTTLAACTAGGPSTSQNQATTPGSTTSSYSGPAAKNADVTNFQINLWANLRSTAMCSNCHHEGSGGQTPMFARGDDINAAYDAANPLVNFTQPDQSTLVLKVGSGHNCWLPDAKSCSDIMLTWIQKWLGTSASSNSGTPPLTPPSSSDVAGGKLFPPSALTEGTTGSNNSFKETVYKDLSKFCSGCHTASSPSPQTPYFATGGTPGIDCVAATGALHCTDSDIEVAYAAAQAKLNLNAPEQSRFYVRLHDENHNCWAVGGPSADCAASAADMLAKIKAFADGIAVTTVDTTQLLSKAIKLKDGTVASGGNRAEASLVAKYEFKTIDGNTAFDTSGVAPSADLQLTGDVTQAGGWGINIGKGGMAKALVANSAKLASMIKATGEFSIETWAAPANVAQANAWIVSYSGSDTTRNVTLGQQATQYSAATRSDKTSANGNKTPLLTDKTNFPAQAALQHIVLTYDATNGQQIYLNGVPTGAIDKTPGSLASWDNTFALVLGSETTGKEQWLGTIKFVAIHSRALTKDQVLQNYNAGVGEKYFMLFDVTSLTGVPQSYVEITGAVLDTYAYQFSVPTFVSLNPNATISNIALKGMRVGVNGVELSTGQSYATLNTTLTANNQVLSGVGAVVAADKGVDSDMFFLTFDQIGTHTHARTEPAVLAAAPVIPALPPSRKGVKNFAQVNAALSQITGVPVTNSTVNTMYNTLQQSLPPTNDLGAFLASHQTAISALADTYCNQAVTTSAAAVFPGLNLANGNTMTYFGTTAAPNTANLNLVINPLVARAIGSNVNPTVEAAVRTEITSLITTLAGTTPTVAGRTASITQAACTAVLGSAAVSLQ